MSWFRRTLHLNEARWRHRFRSLVAVACVGTTLAAGGCVDAKEGPPASVGYMTVDEIRAAGNDVIGDKVILRGEVAQLISPHLARIGAREIGEGEGLLVASRDVLGFGRGDTVEIEGIVRPWDVTDVEIFLNENANLELYHQLEDEDLVVEVTDSRGVEGQ